MFYNNRNMIVILVKSTSASLEFQLLLRHLVEQYCERKLSDNRIEDDAANKLHITTCNWRPKGVLVAHLNEHRSSVNR